MKSKAKLITVFHKRNCLIGILAAMIIGVVCATTGWVGVIAAPLGVALGMGGGFMEWWWHFEWTDRPGEWA